MGLPRGKRTNYDTGLRVPLIVRMPEKFGRFAPAAPGETTERLVSFVDFAPTVLSLTGLPIPAAMQGRPFLGHKVAPPRECVFAARDRVDEVFDCSRAVRDARWLYIRNYMPHLSWMPPEGFSDQSLMRQELVQLAAAGKLNAAQMTYAAPTRPQEELYDTVADPWQLHNLADSREHRSTFAQMRQRLRTWQQEIRDVGFLTEHDLVVRCGGRPPYQWAHEKGTFPWERVLMTADSVGRDDALHQQIRRMSDADRSVRYWAAVGQRAQGPRAADAAEVLRAALDDVSASVRIEAAAALAACGETEQPLKVLVAELNGPDAHAAVHAARTLQLLGQRARPVAKEMRAALEAAGHPSRTADTRMYLDFALKTALRELDAPNR
jgi:hypothetical protein